MAMFPNASRGYMPFVQGKSTVAAKSSKRSKTHVNGGKLHKVENRKHASASGFQKVYQITLKDKKGQTYKCIVKTDGTKSLPELCEARLGQMAAHSSMPNIHAESSPAKQRRVLAEKMEALNSDSCDSFSTSLDLRNCGKKEGFFSAFIRFIKEKTGKSDSKDSSKPSKKTSGKSNGKSKRKPRDLTQRKRQRTVSAMSNLDPIEESPNEHEYEGDDDNDSYTHFDSSSGTESDVSSMASSNISCNIEQHEVTHS